MTVEEEWSAIVQPWTRDLGVHGFSFLERAVRNGMPPSPDATFLCSDYYFDGASTFFDLNGVLARGAHPPGALIGFNGVQMYTFVRDAEGETNFVLTNGEPPNAPEPKWPLMFRWIEARVPERFKALRMQTPDDVPRVLEKHRQSIAEEGGEVLNADRARPLEWRWDMMKELEE